MGMADGRCFTIHTSAQLLNDYVMKQNNISYADNYSYRQLLQRGGPDVMTKLQDIQDTQPAQGRISACDKPLLNVSNTY